MPKLSFHCESRRDLFKSTSLLASAAAQFVLRRNHQGPEI